MPLNDLQRDVLNEELSKIPKAQYQSNIQTPASAESEPEIQLSVEDKLSLLKGVIQNVNLVLDDILQEPLPDELTTFFSELKGQVMASLQALNLLTQIQPPEQPEAKKKRKSENIVYPGVPTEEMLRGAPNLPPEVVSIGRRK
ncbi:MAG: hypothetical protein AB1567_04520 [bacterium]